MKGKVMRGKGDKSNPHLLQAQQALDYHFGVELYHVEMSVTP